jgi:hypothetical protein
MHIISFTLLNTYAILVCMCVCVHAIVGTQTDEDIGKLVVTIIKSCLMNVGIEY